VLTQPMILYWRRTDVVGLERLTLGVSNDAVVAESTVICVEDGGCRLDHRWELTSDWRALSLEVVRWGPAGHKRIKLERLDGGWSVDGARRPDLDGADEPDLSITPFCNTFPIRRTPRDAGASLTVDTCFVDGAAMTVARSRQRYERLGTTRFRYVDLGLSAGFEADLDVDDHGLVVRYQDLFERVTPT
jgi:uncharacterized protein